jgi:hypothetical protein
MPHDVVSASTQRASDSDAVADLAGQLEGVDASAVLLFMGHLRDGAAIVRGLHERFPSAEVVGCTTAGEFTERSYGVGGAVAIALSRRKASRAVGALARFDGGVLKGVRAATDRISERLGKNLRECDPARYVGLVLLEGIRQKEEEANDALGQVAPFLSFVGGSAADEYCFEETRVYGDGGVSTDGAALLVLEMESPFSVLKTSSFRTRAGASFRVTKADPSRRTVYELDGKPIVDAYAGALGVPSQELGRSLFAVHPLGLMIEGAAWIRSPQAVEPDGGIRFACQLLEGMQVHIMDPTDLIDDTRRAFAEGERSLKGPVAGAILFNCVHRRIDLEERKLTHAFMELLRFPTAGFHTYGESWLGHMNHTLTGLLIG